MIVKTCTIGITQADPGRYHRKGGAVSVIVWQTGTACLLPRLVAGHSSGPGFFAVGEYRDSLLL
jgi:integrase/recombinase XerC/integrase/recombinase XerD